MVIDVDVIERERAAAPEPKVALHVVREHYNMIAVTATMLKAELIAGSTERAEKTVDELIRYAERMRDAVDRTRERLI